MKLNHHKKNHLSYARADTPPPSRAHIATRVIYISILLLVVGYITYQIVRYTLFINEFGIITRDTLPLTSTKGGRIEQLLVARGDKIKAGDKIAIVSNLEDCEITEDNRIEKLSFDIAADQLELESIVQEREFLKQQNSSQALTRALEINRSLFGNEFTLQTEIKKLSLAINQQQKRIDLASQRLADLKILHQSQIERESCGIETLAAPYDGAIVTIKRWPLEVIEARSSIAEMVPEDAPTRVAMTINFDLFDDIRVGDSYNITFADGNTDIAVVESIQSAQSGASDTLFSSLLGAQTLQVILAPTTDSVVTWSDYYRMAARIEGIK